MPAKMALIAFDRCHPENCDGGTCAAVMACPRKLLKQEAPYAVPMPDTSICRGCGDCVRACPLEAILLITGIGWISWTPKSGKI